MRKRGPRRCLTSAEQQGTYTYLQRGTSVPCFPNWLNGDIGGARGEIRFSRGALTNYPRPYKGVVGADATWIPDGPANAFPATDLGVDVVFDFKGPCWIDELYVRTPEEHKLTELEVATKPDADAPFHTARRLRARDLGPLGGTEGTHVREIGRDARWVRVRVRGARVLSLRYVEIHGARLEALDAAEALPITPSPRQARTSRGRLRLADLDALRYTSGASAKATAAYLRARLPARARLSALRATPGVQALALGPRDAMDALLDRADEPLREADLGPEGYRLSVTPQGALLQATTDRGLYYAAQTLLQLAAGAESLPCLTLTDWPDKPIRGVHLFIPERREIPFFKRFVSDFLSRLKFNTIFMQVAGGMEYKRHPEINKAWMEFARTVRESGRDTGMRPANDSQTLARHQNCTHWDLCNGGTITQDEVRDLVAHCRAHHMEVIPEVQSLSHCYYLMLPHKELAEDRHAQFPDTYCPSNPQVYPYLFDVIDEVLDVFEPRVLHIGHDEWYTMCICPECRGKSAAKLFAQDVQRIHDHLARKGVRTAMWADRLHPHHGGLGWRGAVVLSGYFTDGREVCSAVSEVPKDILAVNWSNQLPDAEVYYREHGFEQILGNFNPGFPDYEARTRAPEILGGEVSTWVRTCERDYAQGLVRNMLLCAHALWTGRFFDDRVCADNKLLRGLLDARRCLHPRTSPWLDPRRGSTALSLGRKANQVLPARVDADRFTVAGVLFRMRKSGDGLRVVAVDSPRQAEPVAPDRVEGLSVGAKAASLVFLHATSDNDIYRMPSKCYRGALGEEVGRYAVRYADGKRATVPVRYGEHVQTLRYAGGLAQTGVCYWALPVWQSADEQGRPVTLYAYEWINPRPQVKIASLDVEATRRATDVTLYLAGVTIREADGG